MMSAQEWVPKVSCDLKLHAEWKSEVNVNKQTNMMARFQHRPMQSLLAYQSPPNEWQKAER